MLAVHNQQQSRPTLNPALKDFWQTKADIKILKGGRASSKTWDAAGFAVFLASKYTLKFLCMRQFQNRIAQSVYANLVIQIDRFGLTDEFDVLKNTIRHKYTGSEFHFYGIQRNIQEIKGFEGADICWIEEGDGLTKEQWGIIEPILRKEGAEAWIIYNPRLANDFVESFVTSSDNNVLVRHINYDENPFLSETMLRKIERLKRDDYDEYEHIYLGVTRTDDDAAVIKRSWIMAAIDAHKKLGIEPSGMKRIGFDIADSGADKNSVVLMDGVIATFADNWSGGEDELLISCTRAYNKAREVGAKIFYDSIGVGAAAGAKFGELNEALELDQFSGEVEFSKFVAGANVVNPNDYYIDSGGDGVLNKDFFSNLKAQAWWLVADRFRNTYNAIHRGESFSDDELISISSDIDGLNQLVTQLSTPRRKYDSAGRMKVETKEELARRGVASPNDADAFIIANAPLDSNNVSGMGDVVVMSINSSFDGGLSS